MCSGYVGIVLREPGRNTPLQAVILAIWIQDKIAGSENGNSKRHGVFEKDYLIESKRCRISRENTLFLGATDAQIPAGGTTDHGVWVSAMAMG